MKTVRITYTTQAEFAEQNKMNIQQVMNDLRQLNNQGIQYHACVNADGVTFVHTAFFNSDSEQKVLSELPSFKYFQEQLKASGPAAPPKQEVLNFIGASYTLFNN